MSLIFLNLRWRLRVGDNMITWKCLYKLDKEELSGIVNDIKNGES